MSDFKTKTLPVLNDIKGSGSFVSHHAEAFQFPGLKVEGIGELAYPIIGVQAKALIEKAHVSPFGVGSETILDPTVRKGREIGAADLKFTGDGWSKFLGKVLSRIKPDLGIEDYDVSAHLDKMLIYEKGDFFLPHKDTEKEKGMFGTLIVVLPCRYTGGELLVRFDGKEKCVDFAPDAGNFKIPFAAFYADCEHEIKPITSGCRVCLTYNLVQKKAAKRIKIEPLEKYVTKLTKLLQEVRYDPAKPTKIFLLGHQYTPDGFSMQTLKLNDRDKAEALLRAADKAGYHAKMALVTSYRMGLPDGGHYYDDVDEDSEMVEVYDESLSIEHWANDGTPSLDIQFVEDDLIASFKLDEDEPIVKEATGYMGNYGPDLMHWYYYGAVILWPKISHANLLLRQNIKTKLEWVDYYNNRKNELTQLEVSAVESILSSDLDAKNYQKLDYTPIVQWLIHKKDERYFADTGSNLLQRYFLEMDTWQLARLAGIYPTVFVETMTALMARRPELSVFEHFLFLLNGLASDINPDLNHWVSAQVETLPRVLVGFIENENKGKPVVKKETWANILELEKRRPQSGEWTTEMANLITICKQRNYINNVLTAQIMTRKQKTPLSDAVLNICREDLEKRVNDKPNPPENWTRALPETASDSGWWAVLASFLQSPTESVFDYRKNKNERLYLERTIKSVVIDLKMETIKKGSPHTLRITKTQASYHRQMRMWEEDAALLEEVKGKLES